MNGYHEITEFYASYPHIELGPVPLRGRLEIEKLFKDPDGRVFVPTALPEAPNLFAVLSCDDEHTAIVAEFATLVEAEQFLEAAAEGGHEVLTEHGKWKCNYTTMYDNEAITRKYASIPRVELAALKNDSHLLFIANLIKDWDGHIVIPEMGGRREANLFAVLAATAELTLVAEFWDYDEAKKFLDAAEAKGWTVNRTTDILAGVRWLSHFAPTSARCDFPWVQTEFACWLLPAEERNAA